MSRSRSPGRESTERLCTFYCPLYTTYTKNSIFDCPLASSSARDHLFCNQWMIKRRNPPLIFLWSVQKLLDLLDHPLPWIRCTQIVINPGPSEHKAKLKIYEYVLYPKKNRWLCIVSQTNTKPSCQVC